MLIQIMAHKLMGSRRRLACGRIKQEKFFCTWGNSLKIPLSALRRGGPASEFFTFQEKRKWDLLWIQSARLRTFANKSDGPLFWLPTRGVAIRKDWHKKSGLEGRSENGLLMSGSYIKMIKAELGCRGWTGTATSQFGWWIMVFYACWDLKMEWVR